MVMQSKKILERMNVVPALIPVDLKANACCGVHIHMDKGKRLLALISFADGSATPGDDIIVHVVQSVDKYGVTEKSLRMIDNGRVYTKEGADQAALDALTKCTKNVIPFPPHSHFYDTGSGTGVGLIEIEIRQEDLDTYNGYEWVSVQLAATANTKIVSMDYCLEDLCYESAPEDLEDPLV